MECRIVNDEASLACVCRRIALWPRVVRLRRRRPFGRTGQRQGLYLDGSQRRSSTWARVERSGADLRSQRPPRRHEPSPCLLHGAGRSQRPNGLSINGAPDFLGIAAWIFDIYLTCRAAGRSPDAAWGDVEAWITQSAEWKARHPGEPSKQPQGCTSSLQLDRSEFLTVQERLDAYYRDFDGLQRPGGLSIGGAPDFAGIAAWVFDVYLNARLAGRPADGAWSEVVRNIQNSDEWKSKHSGATTALRFAVIGDYGLAGEAERDVANLVKSWGVDFVISTGDNNYPDGGAATIDANIGQDHSSFIFPYSGRFGSTATQNRFFPTLGNHDWDAAGALPYLNYFTLPGNERYTISSAGPSSSLPWTAT